MLRIVLIWAVVGRLSLLMFRRRLLVCWWIRAEVPMVLLLGDVVMILGTGLCILRWLLGLFLNVTTLAYCRAFGRVIRPACDCYDVYG